MVYVEFVSGPYDGHREHLAHPPAEELAWLVCRDIFLLLDGQKQKGRGTITSVAIYELDVCDGQFRYQFQRAISHGDLANHLLVRQALTDGTS